MRVVKPHHKENLPPPESSPPSVPAVFHWHRSRAVTLQCVPGVAKGFARLGIADVPRVRLVTAGDQ